MSSDIFKIFLSGSVKKGQLNKKDDTYFWSQQDITTLKKGLNFDVVIHNPNELEIDLTDSRNRFLTDLVELLSSDFVVVNANTKKGIGVGAEMYIARAYKIPVYTIAPIGSYYHRYNEFNQEWIHPFVHELSNIIFDSVDDLVEYLNDMWKKEKLSKNILTRIQIQKIIEELFSFDAGYDEGYKYTKNFWGDKPAEFVRQAVQLIRETSITNLKSIDLGCGHGKNSLYMQRNGFDVTAIDCSSISIEQARSESGLIRWQVDDIRKISLSANYYDLVVMTGSLHCLDNKDQIIRVVREAQKSTKHGGYNVISSFNDRKQLILGHSYNFVPCLLSHEEYIDLYDGWTIVQATDTDLNDIHPNTNIQHLHSITRILAKKN